MTYIHFLRGSGDNCTCYDCPVLYGFDCPTTPENNFLDQLEASALKYLNLTPTGKVRKVSDSYMDSCINDIVRPKVKKFERIHRNQFDRKYYCFMPLLYLITSDRKEGANRWYRKARGMLYNQIIAEIKTASKEPLENDD